MRIAVTQRVEVVPSYGERRDCLDQQWACLLERLGFSLVPVPNRLRDPRTWIEGQAVTGLVLSGGNDLAHLLKGSNPAPERDSTESQLLSWAADKYVPVLGVCRGMQMINHFLGGSVSMVDGHVACRHKVESLADSLLFSAYREVNSYHGWGLVETDLAGELSPAVWSKDGTIEAYQHNSLPWIGVMWHPERESPVSTLDEALLQRLFVKP